MEPWSVRDERPYLRHEPRSHAWVVVLALALIAGIAAASYWYATSERLPSWLVPPQTASAPAAAPPAAAPPAPKASPEPEVRRPLPPPQAEPARPLPALDVSDTMMRHELVELMGGEAFASLVIPKDLVRRFVATVDNLPRESAPRRMVPLKAVPGSFRISRSGEQASVDPANFARYAPYVRALEALGSRALVKTYVYAYPLFQRAYEQLGFPGRHFNDRLLDAIDDLLAAPQIDGPIQLLQPRVLYEFADPDLETRSAGQKIMVRMGPANAARVKAKLREIRRELIAASERRQ
ncbi:MAG: DUF3014 domain-containing protein [Betaproteobacteria bacterium]